MEVKYFGKNSHINDVYAEYNKAKAFEERYWKFLQDTGDAKQYFLKWRDAHDARVYYGEIIAKYKRRSADVKPWEGSNGQT